MTALAIAMVRWYQRRISPLLPPMCKFTPSCSAYAVEAFGTYSFLYAARLTIGRVARCGPWTR